ncbi:hypothetical protein [Xenophilus sp. Marseille-Q4582]|uniref:GT99 family glycosyltransferase N-terminal domain-containing protein n=1 Tax=Xenophilus sp. Marseille-Q4582 TaxID=2866600 RepID=UPI001CE409AD|nr:hypothetical protein [Xenophilus sp. Marseille-Q4582]
MFVSVLLPFVDRGSGPLFHWVMLAQMARFEVEDVAFIGDSAYFDESSIPFGDWLKLGGLRFQCPDQRKFRAFHKIELAPELFADMAVRIGGGHLDLFRHLLTEPDPAFAACLEQHLRELAQHNDIEALLSWCNLPALSRAAAQMGGVPVIHNELGPLRSPLYRDTIYFDFHGVNGCTSPPTWSQDWVRQQLEGSDLLEPARLRGLLVADSARVQALERTPPVFRAGVALQVEDDSNVVAYASGWTPLQLLYDAIGRFGADQVSVRGHPGAHFVYRGGLGQADASTDSLAFLASVEELVSVNSSLLAEAALWGRRFDAKGDTPMRFLAQALATREPEWAKVALNAFFLAYLVPADLLFDPAYYRWRLTMPTLARCHERHMAALHLRSGTAIEELPGGSDGLRASGGLVRVPALWTGTLSLERQLEQIRVQLDQSRQQAALREAELLGELAGERERANRWEAEAKQNWRDKEALGARLTEAEAREAQARARRDTELERALERERLSLQELAQARAELDSAEAERLQLHESYVALSQAVEALAEWSRRVPHRLGDEAVVSDEPPVPAAAAATEAGLEARPAAGQADVEAVLLAQIDRLSRRLVAAEGEDALPSGEQAPVGAEPLAQVQWLQAQLQALQADLSNQRWQNFCVRQAHAALQADIAEGGGALVQALRGEGMDPGWNFPDRIGGLAAAVAAHMAALRSRLEATRRRPLTVLERITGRPMDREAK